MIETGLQQRLVLEEVPAQQNFCDVENIAAHVCLRSSIDSMAAYIQASQVGFGYFWLRNNHDQSPSSHCAMG